MQQVNRTKRLRAYCRDRKKHAVAKRLGINRFFFGYLYNCKDLDKLIERIDALPVEQK